MAALPTHAELHKLGKEIKLAEGRYKKVEDASKAYQKASAKAAQSLSPVMADFITRTILKENGVKVGGSLEEAYKAAKGKKIKITDDVMNKIVDEVMDLGTVNALEDEKEYSHTKAGVAYFRSLQKAKKNAKTRDEKRSIDEQLNSIRRLSGVDRKKAYDAVRKNPYGAAGALAQMATNPVGRKPLEKASVLVKDKDRRLMYEKVVKPNLEGAVNYDTAVRLPAFQDPSNIDAMISTFLQAKKEGDLESFIDGYQPILSAKKAQSYIN